MTVKHSLFILKSLVLLVVAGYPLLTLAQGLLKVDAPMILSPHDEVKVVAAYEFKNEKESYKATLTFGWLNESKHQAVVIIADAPGSVRILPFQLQSHRPEGSQITEYTSAIAIEDLNKENGVLETHIYSLDFYINDVSANFSAQASAHVSLAHSRQNSPRQTFASFEYKVARPNGQLLPLSHWIPTFSSALPVVKRDVGPQFEVHAIFDLPNPHFKNATPEQHKARAVAFVNKHTLSTTIVESTAKELGVSLRRGDTRYGSLVVVTRPSTKGAIQNIKIAPSDALLKRAPNFLRSVQLRPANLDRATTIEVKLVGSDALDTTRYAFFRYRKQLPLKKTEEAYGLLIKHAGNSVVVPLVRNGSKFYGPVDYFDPVRGQMTRQTASFTLPSDWATLDTQIAITLHDLLSNDRIEHGVHFKTPPKEIATKSLGAFQQNNWLHRAQVFCGPLGASPRWHLCFPKSALDDRRPRNIATAIWDAELGSTQILPAQVHLDDSGRPYFSFNHPELLWYSPFYNAEFPLQSPLYSLRVSIGGLGDLGRGFDLEWEPRLGFRQMLLKDETRNIAHPRIAATNAGPGRRSLTGFAQGASKLCDLLINASQGAKTFAAKND